MTYSETVWYIALASASWEIDTILAVGFVYKYLSPATWRHAPWHCCLSAVAFLRAAACGLRVDRSRVPGTSDPADRTHSPAVSSTRKTFIWTAINGFSQLCHIIFYYNANIRHIHCLSNHELLEAPQHWY